MKITYCKYLEFDSYTERYRCPYKHELNQNLLFNKTNLVKEKRFCPNDAFRDEYNNFICWKIEG